MTESEKSELTDCSASDSNFQRVEFSHRAPKLKRMEIEAESIKLKVGKLVVGLNATGFGTIEIDGVPLRSRRLVIVSKPGEIARITIDAVPY